MGRIKRLFRNLKYISKFDLQKAGLVQMRMEDLLENFLYYVPNSGIVRPQVLDADETLNMLCNTNKSLARFGDGEISIINGHGIPYQEYDALLAARMREMLKNKDENIMVGINHWYFFPVYNRNDNEIIKRFNIFDMPWCRRKLFELINPLTSYVDAGFTGVKKSKNKKTDDFFKKLRTIWADKNIVVVDNFESRSKIKHDIFDNAKNKININVPSTNSFREYKNVLEKIKQHSTDNLIVLLAGPLSKVLVADLSGLGYRALDLGHIAKSYDWYCRDIELSDKNLESFWAPDL